MLVLFCRNLNGVLHLPLVNVFISVFSSGILTLENLVKTELRSCEESLLSMLFI